MVKIIEVLIRIEGETPAAFKERIAAVQVGTPTQDLPEGAIGRATITPEGLHADMRWGQAHKELPAEVCVVAWWPLEASKGKFVSVDQAVISQALRRAGIATQYAGEMRKLYKGAHTGLPGSIHYSFADAIMSKNAYALEHLANGLNAAAKAAFSTVTGVALPKQQGATWKAIRAWAGVSDAADAVVKAQHKVKVELRFLSSSLAEGEGAQVQAWVRDLIGRGFNQLTNANGTWLFVNAAGDGVNLSKRGTQLHKARPLIEAELALVKAQAELDAEVTLKGGPALLAA